MGVEIQEEDDEVFEEKMKRLVAELETQFVFSEFEGAHSKGAGQGCPFCQPGTYSALLGNRPDDPGTPEKRKLGSQGDRASFAGLEARVS